MIATVLSPLKLDGVAYAAGARVELTAEVFASLPPGVVQRHGHAHAAPEIPHMALPREVREARAHTPPHPHARIDELAQHPPVTEPHPVTIDQAAMARHPGLTDEADLAGAPGEEPSLPRATRDDVPPPPPVGEKTHPARKR